MPPESPAQMRPWLLALELQCFEPCQLGEIVPLLRREVPPLEQVWHVGP